MRRLALLLVLTTACAQRSDPGVGTPRRIDPPPSVVVVADSGLSALRSSDLAVYAAVLDSVFIAGRPSAISQIVVQDSTQVFKRERLVEGVIEELYKLPGVDSTAVRDFEARTRLSRSLAALRQVKLRLPIVLIDRATLRSLPRNNADLYWRAFYPMYPGSSGHIALSSIGYDATGELAVLMADQYCGSLCGNGYIVAVRRVGGVWRVTAFLGTWVS